MPRYGYILEWQGTFFLIMVLDFCCVLFWRENKGSDNQSIFVCKCCLGVEKHIERLEGAGKGEGLQCFMCSHCSDVMKPVCFRLRNETSLFQTKAFKQSFERNSSAASWSYSLISASRVQCPGGRGHFSILDQAIWFPESKIQNFRGIEGNERVLRELREHTILVEILRYHQTWRW